MQIYAVRRAAILCKSRSITVHKIWKFPLVPVVLLICNSKLSQQLTLRNCASSSRKFLRYISNLPLGKCVQLIECSPFKFSSSSFCQFFRIFFAQLEQIPIYSSTLLRKSTHAVELISRVFNFFSLNFQVAGGHPAWAADQNHI